MYDDALLKIKTKAELRQILIGMGADYHPREIEQTLIDRIHLLSNTTQPNDRAKPPVETKKPVSATPIAKDVLMDAVAPFVARGMKVEVGEGYWMFSNDKKMDSGTLSQPIEVIRRCAQLIMNQ